MAFVSTERTRIGAMSCFDIVAMGRAPHTNWIGRLCDADIAAVESALEAVGMSSFAGRRVASMSDGECQRVMIARALAQDTPLILMDEPTSFLDLPNRYELCTLLAELAHSHGKCIVFSTHELDIAVNLADDIALIDTPHLLHMPVCDMLEAGHIARVFNAARSSSSASDDMNSTSTRAFGYSVGLFSEKLKFPVSPKSASPRESIDSCRHDARARLLICL